jgi:hypothetical protein
MEEILLRIREYRGGDSPYFYNIQVPNTNVLSSLFIGQNAKCAWYIIRMKCVKKQIEVGEK